MMINMKNEDKYSFKGYRPLMVSFEKIEDMVEDILSRYPAARNDDRVLVLLFWKEMQGFEMPDEFKIPYLSGSLLSPDVLSRMRRRIQNSKNKYKPVESIKLKRRKMQEEYRESMPLKNLDDIIKFIF